MGFRGRKSDQSEISIHKLFINNFLLINLKSLENHEPAGQTDQRCPGWQKMTKSGKKMANVRENMVNNCEPT